MRPRKISLDVRIQQAVRFFWQGRISAIEKQSTGGRLDQGNRGAVTGGKNLDGFRSMMLDVIAKHGPEACEVYHNRTMVVLPGFYRPVKQWDLLVVHQGRLLVALELKSLCGPSFGNNANNRCEEAIGSGHDFRRAQSEGLFGKGASPFLGYFLLVEDAPGSQRPVTLKSSHFPADEVFQETSYQQRMRILCERMVEQQLYSAASILVAPNSPTSGEFSDLSPTTGFRYFLSRLAGHLAGERELSDSSSSRVREDDQSAVSESLLEGDWFESIEESDSP